MRYTGIHEHDRAMCVEWAKQLIERDDWVILDTETTDLRGYVVQLVVIDRYGQPLMNSLLNPQAHISREAQAVHGISASDVADAAIFADVFSTFKDLTRNKEIIAYNAEFDKKIIRNETARLGQPLRRRWTCAMQPYSAYYGKWNYRRRSYVWQKLPQATHDALDDCRAVLDLIKRMAQG